MHAGILDFVDRSLSIGDVAGKRVLDVGSYNVNGSARPLVMRYEPELYIGIDMREGPDVDEVLDACMLIQRFGENSFDIVICAELLEHAEDWRAVIENLKAVTKIAGLLIVTTRSWGFPLHDFPSDYWRFEVADMQQIFSDTEGLLIENDPFYPGVFVKARKAGGSSVLLSDIAVRSLTGEYK